LGGKLQKCLSAKQKAKSTDCAFVKVRQLKQRFFTRKLLQNDRKNASNIENCKVVKAEMLHFV